MEWGGGGVSIQDNAGRGLRVILPRSLVLHCLACLGGSRCLLAPRCVALIYKCWPYRANASGTCFSIHWMEGLQYVVAGFATQLLQPFGVVVVSWSNGMSFFVEVDLLLSWLPLLIIQRVILGTSDSLQSRCLATMVRGSNHVRVRRFSHDMVLCSRLWWLQIWVFWHSASIWLAQSLSFTLSSSHMVLVSHFRNVCLMWSLGLHSLTLGSGVNLSLCEYLFNAVFKVSLFHVQIWCWVFSMRWICACVYTRYHPWGRHILSLLVFV